MGGVETEEAGGLAIGRFRAMGTAIEFQVPAERRDVLGQWQARVLALEALASRFLPDSALSRFNRGEAGLHPGLLPLLDAAEALRVETGGLFDHRLLHALLLAGYSRSLDPAAPSGLPSAESGIDLGGVAKGWLADQLVGEADEAGYPALANLGGDVRVSRLPPPGQDAWLVGVEDPGRAGEDLAVLAVTGRGVATSSVRRRRWPRAGGEAHHVIDPRTGEPAATDLVAATVVASSGVRAEGWAKAALLLGSAEGPGRLEVAGVAGLLVTDGGRVAMTRGMEPLRASSFS